jgi:ankyrin repeat protein
MLCQKNLRSATPLILAVDTNNHVLFQYLLEMYVHIQRSVKKHPLLEKTFKEQEKEKGETVLLRAVRCGRIEMVFMMLHLIGPDLDLEKSEYFDETDKAGRNILQHAVLTKQRDLVERFINTLDSDN